jgi:hypothetical protein
MAFPQVATSDSTTGTTAKDTSHAITLPGNISAGNLLLVFFSTDGDNTITNWGGFTELFSQSNGTVASLHVGYKTAVGSDTLTITTSVSEPGAYACYRITGHNTSQMPEVSTGATDASQYPNPDTLTPTGGAADFLWIAAHGHDHIDTVNIFPLPYNNLSDQGSASGDCGLGVCSTEANQAALDPSSFSLSGSEQWVACTVAVHPASGGSLLTFVADMYGDSDVPANVLSVLRKFVPNVLGDSLTSSSILEVLRKFVADVYGDSLTSSAELELLRKFVADMYGDSLTSSAELEMLRKFVADMYGDSLTSSAALEVLRKFVADMYGDSNIPNTADLGIFVLFAASIVGESLCGGEGSRLLIDDSGHPLFIDDSGHPLYIDAGTASTVALQILRKITATPQGDSNVSVPRLDSIRKIITNIYGDTDIPSAQLAVIRKFIANVYGDSDIPNTAILGVFSAVLEVLRKFIANMYGDSLTSSAELEMLRKFVANMYGDSDIPNTAELVVASLVLFAANILGESLCGGEESRMFIDDSGHPLFVDDAGHPLHIDAGTASTVALQILRKITATPQGDSDIPSAELITLRKFIANMFGDSNIPNTAELVIAGAVLLCRVRSTPQVYCKYVWRFTYLLS